MFKLLSKMIAGAVVALSLAAAPTQAADCSKALVTVFGHEGGYSADKHDPGNWTSGKVGVGKFKGTKFGIAANSFPNLDIKHLTLAQATKIYKQNYWNRLRLDEIKSQAVATIMFDAAVNMGAGYEATVLQRAVNLTNYPRPDIKVNGVIDDMTINMVNKSLNKKALFNALCGLQFDRYQYIVSKNKNMERYMVSWLSRIGDYGQNTTPVLKAKLEKRGYKVIKINR